MAVQQPLCCMVHAIVHVMAAAGRCCMCAARQVGEQICDALCPTHTPHDGPVHMIQGKVVGRLEAAALALIVEDVASLRGSGGTKVWGLGWVGDCVYKDCVWDGAGDRRG